MSNDSSLVRADRLRDYCRLLFEKAGIPQEESLVNADMLVEGDLTGVDSHGVSRMPIYLKRLRAGVYRPKLEYKVIADMPATAVVDGGNSMGAVVAQRAMRDAIAKARTAGVSFVSVRNSNHYGAAAYFARMALGEDMIGFTATNSASRTAPWGGREPMLGTNPFAWAIPANRRLPIVADMASCMVARGKIILAAKQNKPIPSGWALTRDGEDTTDAKVALDGCVLPFGQAKGSAIATVIEVLTGVLAGSLFSTRIPDMNTDLARPAPTSHYFGALNLAAFGPVSEFKNHVDELIDMLKQSKKAKGVEEIFLPGEIEHRTRQHRLKEGIPLLAVTLNDLKKEGELSGVPFMLDN